MMMQDPDYYKEAWQVSNSRSSRAMKSLGLWHLRQEQYAESVECLQKSLAINSLQAGTASLQSHDYHVTGCL